ncbi:MAG: hypothetical protein HKL80_06555 [Acidimicrobiales bacterium]|nr:hypothetical protein [Acidimicrobiales bacterium]
MLASRRLIVFFRLLVPLVVVGIFSFIHAKYIGHYKLLSNFRTTWELLLAFLASFFAYIFEPEATTTWFRRFFSAVAVPSSAVVVISIFQLMLGSPLLPRFVVGSSTLGVAGLLAVFEVARNTTGSLGEGERVLAVVSEEVENHLLHDIDTSPERSIRDVKFISSTLDRTKFGEQVESYKPTLIVLDRNAQSNEELLSSVASYHKNGIRIRTLTLFCDQWLGKLPVSELAQTSLLFDINAIHNRMYSRFSRLMDLVLSVPLLLVLLLLIPLVWVVDLFGNRGKLFYRQFRIGRNGREFSIIKFRTMPAGSDKAEWTDVEDFRLNKVGSQLRRLHIDEIPQVINVILGDMAIVGPRPEQPQYVKMLEEKLPFYSVRHLVRPGITGWAQMKFHYASTDLDALEKLQYEFYYLRHQSVILDLRIILRTIRSLWRRQGR